MDGGINGILPVVGAAAEKRLDADDAGDGGGCQADGAQDASQIVDIGGKIGGLDEAAGEDANEGDLFGETR